MWNDLTMSERAGVIKMAVKAGLRDMKSIRDFYDNSLKYADGGSIHISPSKRGTFTAAATKHGMGVQEFASKVLANKDNYSPAMVKKANFAKNASKWKHDLGGYLFEEGGPKNANREYKSANSLNSTNIRESIYKPLRQRFYDNIRPDGWGENTTERVLNAAVFNKPASESDSERLPLADDLWATYLQIPYNKRHNISTSDKQYLTPARYLPTIGNEGKDEYYKLNNINPNRIDALIMSGSELPIGKNKTDIIIPGLGEHTIGKGIDKKGEYISYYDKYDLDLSNNQNGDSTIGIGKPFNVYDRIYLDDYYEVPNPTHATYLPEVTITGKRRKKVK